MYKQTYIFNILNYNKLLIKKQALLFGFFEKLPERFTDIDKLTLLLVV
jgi:hypothetical protein